MLAHLLTASASIVLFSASLVTAGVNCEGSGLCGALGIDSITAGQLNNLIQDVVPSYLSFSGGEKIACVSGSTDAGDEYGLCAFPQGSLSGPLSAADAKTLSQDLINHGCKVCGSVPVQALSGGNSDDEGILTFNYVSSPGCNGVCAY
jgi:hypothetical protein